MIKKKVNDLLAENSNLRSEEPAPNLELKEYPVLVGGQKVKPTYKRKEYRISFQTLCGCERLETLTFSGQPTSIEVRMKDVYGSYHRCFEYRAWRADGALVYVERIKEEELF